MLRSLSWAWHHALHSHWWCSVRGKQHNLAKTQHLSPRSWYPAAECASCTMSLVSKCRWFSDVYWKCWFAKSSSKSLQRSIHWSHRLNRQEFVCQTMAFMHRHNTAEECKRYHFRCQVPQMLFESMQCTLHNIGTYCLVLEQVMDQLQVMPRRINSRSAGHPPLTVEQWVVTKLTNSLTLATCCGVVIVPLCSWLMYLSRRHILIEYSNLAIHLALCSAPGLLKVTMLSFSI